MLLLLKWALISLLSLYHQQLFSADDAKVIVPLVQNQEANDAKATQDDEPKSPAAIDVAKTSEPKINTISTPKIIIPKIPVSPVDLLDHAKTASKEQSVTTNTPIISKSESLSVPIQIEDISAQDSSAGLDTLNVNSGGNWLEKRIWYEKSEKLFEVIRAAVQKVTDLRMEFVRNVNHVGHEIDSFYETIDFERGEIDDLLTMIDQALQNQVEVRGGDLSSSERSLKMKIQEQKEQFDVISKNLQLISDLDEQIDKTMMKAFKEIDTCRGLETRAWNDFKEVGLELDDKRARILYYEMENFHKNIEQKLSYLQSNLLNYLQNQLVSKVVQTIGQIKTKVSDLDSAGMNIKQILQRDEKGDFLILKEREKTQEELAEKQDLKRKKQAALAQTWYSKISTFFMMIFHKIYEWLCVIFCSLRYVLCKIQCLICKLFGY